MEKTIRTTILGVTGMASLAVATSWAGIPGAVASLIIYTGGIAIIMARAHNNCNSEQDKERLL